MAKTNTGNITFQITAEQAEAICEHYGIDRDGLDDWEVEELLDRLIDDAIASDYPY